MHRILLLVLAADAAYALHCVAPRSASWQIARTAPSFPSLRMCVETELPSEAELPSASDSSSLTSADVDPEAQLLQLCAATDRGQVADERQRDALRSLIASLEARQAQPPLLEDGILDGCWSLVYSGVPVYRSSPFFWAFSKVCEGITTPLSPVPGDDSFAEATYAVTDGIPFQRVGVARQTISATGDGALGEGRLVSEIVLKVSLFDALFPPQQSVMTSTAATSLDGQAPGCMKLRLIQTQVKQSTLPIPGLESLAFPTETLFPQLKTRSNEVTLKVTYLSGGVRVTRVPEAGDEYVFVHMQQHEDGVGEMRKRWQE